MASEVIEIFEQQRNAQAALRASSCETRKQKLQRFKENVLEMRQELALALQKDFGKNPSETDLTEIYPLLSEINFIQKHLRSWMKDRKVETPMLLKGTSSYIRYEAKGNVLIISPWNYPIALCLIPMVTALSAGNSVMLKPSEFTPETNKVLKKLIEKSFRPTEVAVFEGEVEMTTELLKLPFNHIFFTGSTAVGKIVMEAASKHLSSVTLELGGKSPVVLGPEVNLELAASRIVWGKYINAGQTCVAPDYVFVHRSQKEELISLMTKAIKKYYGSNEKKMVQSKDLCRIVSPRHFDRLQHILDEAVEKGAKVRFGGVTQKDERFISPTLIDDVPTDIKLLEEEIFGPLLPIMTYDHLSDAVDFINQRPRPLALYIFSENQTHITKILDETMSGGVAINDTLIHAANHGLPFGGINESGLGSYHGEHGFKEVSHERAVLRRNRDLGASYLYPPYGLTKRKLINSMMNRLNRYL